MADFPLKLDPSEVVVFIGERTKELTQNFHLKNISEKTVAYKFLTTEPLHTLFRPNQGLIDPTCENDIIVLLRPDKENKFGNINPQFIVKTIKINESDRHSAIDQLFATAAGVDVLSHRLTSKIITEPSNTSALPSRTVGSEKPPAVGVSTSAATVGTQSLEHSQTFTSSDSVAKTSATKESEAPFAGTVALSGAPESAPDVQCSLLAVERERLSVERSRLELERERLQVERELVNELRSLKASFSTAAANAPVAVAPIMSTAPATPAPPPVVLNTSAPGNELMGPSSRHSRGASGGLSASGRSLADK